MNKKLWGGRFENSTDPHMELFTASIHIDKTLAYDDILGSMAHVDMLGHCGILARSESESLQKGLHSLWQKMAKGVLEFRIEDEDIHMNIERLLHLEIGDVAGKLHTARSRNDQVALDLHLYLRRQTVLIIDLLLTMQEKLVQLARSHREILLPGYTHLQRAQPVFLAQYWLTYCAMLQRDIARLKESWSRINQSPLGAGALNGSTFAIDKHYTASVLGFDGIYLSAMDAVSNRDFIVEFLSAASLIMMHLSRLSEELILWSSQEFNFISMGDNFCTGSSMMPQKKNPDAAELTRGRTGRVYGALLNVLTLLKGLPLTYNRDLQEDKEPLFNTVKTLHSVLTVYTPLLDSLKINPSAMEKATQSGFLNATALAEYLVKKNISFRVAHDMAGKMVAHCIKKNCQLNELSLSEMQQFHEHIDESVYEAITPAKMVIIHDTQNGTQPSAVDAHILSYQQESADTKKWIEEKNQLLNEVATRFKLTSLNPQEN